MKKAIFFLTSPFQILNAIEAYHYYNIDNAKFVFITDESSISRNQMIELANEFKIGYEIILNTSLRRGKIYSLYYLMRNFIFTTEVFKYDCAFLGDAFENQLNIWCSIRTRYKGKIIYLDDGNASLGLLNNGNKMRGIFKLIYDVVCFVMKIEKSHIFTSYYRNQTNKFKVVHNNFSTLSVYMEKYKIENCVYIIGTAVDEYCEYLGVGIDYFLVKLGELFSAVNKTSGSRVIYIPHRRDNNKEVMRLCIKNNINYEHLDMAIEFYFCKYKKCPKEIYGFGSSALHNLKMLFPKLKITNVLLEGSNTNGVNEYKIIGEFYQSENIESLTL